MRTFIAAASCAVVLTAGVVAGASAGPSDGPAKGPAPALDCGDGKKGSKQAFHQFTAELREGDEARVRSLLEDGREFAWLRAYSVSGNGPPQIDERRPGPAAAAVAEAGGIPIVITRFFNIDKPSGTTDAGFKGTWGDRRFIGKGALNCNEGKAIVLTIAVRGSAN